MTFRGGHSPPWRPGPGPRGTFHDYTGEDTLRFSVWRVTLAFGDVNGDEHTDMVLGAAGAMTGMATAAAS